MSKTSDQLISEVAALLGKNVPGEPLDDGDKQVINDNIDPVLEEIANIVAITDRDDIPDRYFQTIARMVALYSEVKFKQIDNPSQAIKVDMAAVDALERRLRYLAAGAVTKEPAKAEFF